MALLRLTGYGFSALAFALALARPAGRIPLYSGNTLATALLGLLLYGRGLRQERRPVFLYAAFAALFLAYFGTHTFIKDLIAPVEGAVGRALGYRSKLPFPFRALNGLAFNALLAGLSLVFTRRWKDDRLAWHCHLIGLPLSLAACILSGFEPLAAVFVMGGYTIAYAVATWLFAFPPVAYLACAAFTGAASPPRASWATWPPALCSVSDKRDEAPGTAARLTAGTVGPAESTRKQVRRAVLLLAGVLGSLMTLPAVAAAHGPVAPVATSYVAKLRSVPPGLEAKVVDGYVRLWLRVSPRTTALVLDYRGAPYLRFDASGVQVNEHSEMYYLNQAPYPWAVPSSLTRATPPRWLPVAAGHAYEWHDGRLQALASVAVQPGSRYAGRWTIPMVLDGHSAVIAGDFGTCPRRRWRGSGRSWSCSCASLQHCESKATRSTCGSRARLVSPPWSR